MVSEKPPPRIWSASSTAQSQHIAWADVVSFVAQEQLKTREEQNRPENRNRRPGLKGQTTPRTEHQKRDWCNKQDMEDLGREAGTSLSSLLPTTTTGINCSFKQHTQHYAFDRRKGIKIHSKQPTEKMQPWLSREKKFLLFAFISNISTWNKT